jgi:hypothetical protein
MTATAAAPGSGELVTAGAGRGLAPAPQTWFPGRRGTGLRWRWRAGGRRIYDAGMGADSAGACLVVALLVGCQKSAWPVSCSDDHRQP